MKDSVVKFARDQGLHLTQRDADNYRPVPPGTYSHRTFHWGYSRTGITDGVHAHMIWSDGVCREVQLCNMTVQLDNPGTYMGPRKKTKLADKEKTQTARRARRLAAWLDELTEA